MSAPYTFIFYITQADDIRIDKNVGYERRSR